MSKSQPKFRASKRLGSGDYLTFAIWPGKSVPEDEIMNIQLRTLQEGQWKTTSKLTIYRRKDGTYSQLSESAPVNQSS
jgi:hypothetical protein